METCHGNVTISNSVDRKLHKKTRANYDNMIDLLKRGTSDNDVDTENDCYLLLLSHILLSPSLIKNFAGIAIKLHLHPATRTERQILTSYNISKHAGKYKFNTFLIQKSNVSFSSNC